jgi:hypothetical protein
VWDRRSLQDERRKQATGLWLVPRQKLSRTNDVDEDEDD